MNSYRMTVPGSKSITQRTLIAAALADAPCELHGPLDSEDTRLLRTAIKAMGCQVDEYDKKWLVSGRSGQLSAPEEIIYMGNNGTGIRFMVSVAALANGTTVLKGNERMSERPVEQLLTALKGWGVSCKSISGNGCPPVKIEGGGISGGQTRLIAEKSSQFLSSLLLVAPYASRPAEIHLDGGLVSRPYVDITISVMSSFGIDVQEKNNIFFIPKGCYKGDAYYNVEGDASSASYFWGAAAVTGKSVTVSNIPQNPIQGDAAFADILEMMGCNVGKDSNGITVTGPETKLKGIDIDMGKWPDVVPTLAAVALFADGKTVIRNVHHLRIKETDRLKAMATELARVGARINELDDGLIIHGGSSLHGAKIETYDDHRIAMSMSIVGLKQDNIKISDPSCVKKSFPDFWKKWDNMRASLLI